jgi:hypothetical protein
VHFLPTHSIFPKCSDASVSLTCWSANRSLASVPCTFRGALSQIEERTRRPHFGDPRSQATVLQNHRVLRPRVFSAVNSHASELLHFPTTWWWVVDWWCGGHDGMNVWMLSMTIVRSSEVFYNQTSFDKLVSCPKTKSLQLGFAGGKELRVLRRLRHPRPSCYRAPKIVRI